MDGDKEVQINVYPLREEGEGRYRSGEHRLKGIITTEATNYIDIICEDGQIAFTLYRDKDTKKFALGVLISKINPDNGDVIERRVYRGNLFDEPFERPSTDAERQALEEEISAMGRPSLRTRAVRQIQPLGVVDALPPVFEANIDLDEPDDDDDDNEEEAEI